MEKEKISIDNSLIKQDIILKSRKRINITGIKKINSLNENEFNVQTSLGLLQIQGSDLSMIQLDLEKGLLEISGNIDSVDYLDKEQTKNKKGIFTRLFKWYIH